MKGVDLDLLTGILIGTVIGAYAGVHLGVVLQFATALVVLILGVKFLGLLK